MLEARLVWTHTSQINPLGRLWFDSPEDGNQVQVAVTTGPHTQNADEHIWHIEVNEGIATVSPSIHFIGHFHSPNPVQFRIIDG